MLKTLLFMVALSLPGRNPEPQFFDAAAGQIARRPTIKKLTTPIDHISFRNATIREVLSALGKKTGVRFRCRDEKLLNREISGSGRDIHLERFLAMIAQMVDSTYVLNNDGSITLRQQ